jgi:hypothetical protein
LQPNADQGCLRKIFSLYPSKMFRVWFLALTSLDMYQYILALQA